MPSPSTIPMWITAAFLAAGGLWRWHGAAVVQTDQLEGVHTPAAVLLVRHDDCPDRRAGMLAWLRGAAPDEALGAPLPVFLGVLSEGGGLPLPEPLDEMPRIDGADARRAGRALLRAGVGGTPALVMVDHEGRVLLTESFTQDGPGPRLALTARLAPSLSPGATTPPDRETSSTAEGR